VTDPAAGDGRKQRANRLTPHFAHPFATDPQVILDFSREIDVELIDRVVNACFFGSGQEVGTSFIAPSAHHSSSHHSNMQHNRP